MSSLPNNPSKSFKRRNPELYQIGIGRNEEGQATSMTISSKPRLRQSSKPLLNKLEQEWFDRLNAQFPNYPRPRAQAIRFKLCNGVTYCPDVFAFSWPVGGCASSPTAWEVKGKMMWDDAVVKLKMAAKEWPEVKWVLCWKEHGEWRTQDILP